MNQLRGIPVSQGIVIGQVFVLDDPDRRPPRRPIPASAAEGEVERLEQALRRSIEELNLLHDKASAGMGAEAARIFLVHVGMLKDPGITDPMREAIRSDHIRAEYAVWSTLRDWAERFRAVGSEALEAKISDLRDLNDRVVGALLGRRHTQLEHLEPGTVVIARELTPSQTAAFDRDKVAALATDLGGRTGHTSIVARALGLPGVVGCTGLAQAAVDGSTVIVDGHRGLVVLEPDEATLEKYEGYIEQQRVAQLSLREQVDLEPVTRDGVRIDLLGNIEFPEEVTGVIDNGGEGIGLYRTEFLYLTRRDEPGEEDHLEAYRRCVSNLQGRPLTIRTIDLGADKYAGAAPESPEPNPFLGLRSIRYSLAASQSFKNQLRAVLRASAHGPVKVMFPLVTSVGELRHAKMLLRDAMEDLDEAGQEYDPEIDVGMMVEVPSAALLADVFAKEVDFFSIGTNDLVQYTLAVDRTNERVAHMFTPTHPAVIRLLRTIVRSGQKAGIPVSVCGESAAELDYAVLLIGLGVRTLSVTSSGIPSLKRLIRGVTTAQCERVARKALTFDSDTMVSQYLRDRTRKLVPEAFEGRPLED